MLTRTGANKILRRIFETGGMTEDMEKDIEQLKNDFDEREGILKKYGETYDGEDLDDYDFKENDNTIIEDTENYKEKYDTIKQKYLDRFFGGVDLKDEVEDIKEETEKDVERDGTKQSFEDLFEKREG